MVLEGETVADHMRRILTTGVWIEEEVCQVWFTARDLIDSWRRRPGRNEEMWLLFDVMLTKYTEPAGAQFLDWLLETFRGDEYRGMELAGSREEPTHWGVFVTDPDVLIEVSEADRESIVAGLEVMATESELLIQGTP